MSTALTILLLTTAAGDADSAFAHEFARATREAVGADAQIDFRALSALPSDDSAASFGAEVHADAVVELSWIEPDELRARLHLFHLASRAWTDLEIGFRAADLPAERARTIGFAVASIFPEHQIDRAAALRPVLKEPTARDATVKTQPVAFFSRAVDALAIVSLGVGDSGGTAGGALDFRWAWSRSFALRIGATLRVGEIPAAQITTQLASGALGLAWQTWNSSDGRASVGLRIDGLLVHTDFAHLSEGDETVHQGKWMLGADVLAEASWFFVEGAAVVAGAGAEATFGETDIKLGTRTFTTLALLHPLAELGLRARF
jgi:hypothetical protein